MKIKFTLGVNKIPAAQSPLTFVVTMMITLFLVVIAVFGATASGRQTSSRYIPFAGLYDLALAANQRAFYLFDQEAQILARLQKKELDLTYKDGSYFIESNFIRAVKQEQLSDFLQQNFDVRGGYYYFSYRLTLTSGTYYVRTYISPRPHAFELRSVAHKEVDGQDGTPVRVYARIEWPNIIDLRYDEFGLNYTDELVPQMLRVRRMAN